jgi:hypothetical protein
MAPQYYTGTVAVPASGAAVPVCRVGPGGCLVIDTTGGGGSTFVGGPDVTPATGMPITTGATAPTFIPGIVPVSSPPYPPAPEDPAPTLYACSAQADTVMWLSSLPKTWP